MTLLLLALFIFLLAGLTALVAGSSARWSTIVGAGGAMIGSLIGLIPTISVLRGAPSPVVRLPWEVPYGSFFIALDALSAFFLLPIFVLSAVAAVYGSEYLQAYREKKSLGASWCFFNLLIASMALVVIARNGVLFLVAWEVMALASFLLVTFHDDEPSVRDAGRLYLTATHAGTAFLLALFVALARLTGSMDFEQWRGAAPAASSGFLFLL